MCVSESEFIFMRGDRRTTASTGSMSESLWWPVTPFVEATSGSLAIPLWRAWEPGLNRDR